MQRANGSTPILALLVAGFLVAFYLQRSASGFLAVEDEASWLKTQADEASLPLAMAMAVCEQADVHDRQSYADRLQAFVRLCPKFGEPLAAVALAGHESAALAAVEQAHGDVDAAWRVVAREPFAIAGVRLLQMQQRFANRLVGDDQNR